MESTDSIGWLAANSLDRYRPALMYAQMSLFLFGCFFWIDANSGGAGFKEVTWGSFAYFIPAKIWAAWNMVASAICIVGLKKPVKTKLVVLGAFLHCLQFSVIAYSTTFTGGEPVVGLFASTFFLPLHMWLLIEAARRWRQ